MKKKFNDNEKDFLEMKLINKIKTITNVAENAIKSKNDSIKTKTECQRLCIYEIKYD